jgi:hypothetical protein
MIKIRPVQFAPRTFAIPLPAPNKLCVNRSGHRLR